MWWARSDGNRTRAPCGELATRSRRVHGGAAAAAARLDRAQPGGDAGRLQALYTNAEEGVYCDKICAQCGRFGGVRAVDDVAWLFDGGVVGNLTVQNDGAACRLKI